MQALDILPRTRCRVYDSDLVLMRDLLLATHTARDLRTLQVSLSPLNRVFADFSAAPAGNGEERRRRFDLAAGSDCRGALADVVNYHGRQGQAPRSERREVRQRSRHIHAPRVPYILRLCGILRPCGMLPRCGILVQCGMLVHSAVCLRSAVFSYGAVRSSIVVCSYIVIYMFVHCDMLAQCGVFLQQRGLLIGLYSPTERCAPTRLYVPAVPYTLP